MLFGIGLRRQRLPEAFRGRWRLLEESADVLLRGLSGAGLAEAFLLLTCERIELYGVGLDHEAFRQLAQRLQAPPEELLPLQARWRDREAARHLFRVAAGLDSTAVGEPEILGQIRAAYRRARAAGTIGPVLGPLVEQALALGRKVRARTALGAGALSLGTLAVRAAHQRQPLTGRTVLIAGAGTMGTQIARAVRRYGPARLIVLSRTPARAQALAQEVGGEAGGLEGLRPALAQADCAFLALAAPQPILRRADLEWVRAQRGGTEPLLIDLGMPPNVESEEGLHPLRLEDLQALAEAQRQRLAEAIVHAEALVEDAVRQWEAGWAGRRVAPLIATLQAQAERIRQQELAWAWPKLGDLTPAQRARIEQLTHRLVRKLLHTPLTQLRALAVDPQALALACRLWGLEEDPAAFPRPNREEPG